MKIPVSKYHSLTIHKDYLTFKVKCGETTITAHDIEQSAKLLLEVEGEYYICEPESVITKNGEISLLLKFNKSFYVIKKLWNITGIDSVNGYIHLPEDTVNDSIYTKSVELLRKAAVQFNESDVYILKKLTTYNGRAGKPDIRFISKEQLPVVHGKLKQLIGGGLEIRN